jgi:RNA polymerase sigma-70 factor, ECF subfamily
MAHRLERTGEMTEDGSAGGQTEPVALPDVHLVRMAQRDPAAFVHLYDRYAQQIYRYCRRRLPAERAEDATSVAFLNALRSIQSMEPERAGFRPWIFAIAHNALIDQTRDRVHDQVDDLWLTDADPPMDDYVVAMDNRSRLQTAIEQLPPDQFAVVSLRLAGLIGPEIAQITGKSHEAVRGLQHRAIRRLRTLLSPDSTDEGNTQ